jgi:type I restriction enzyme S subunit
VSVRRAIPTSDRLPLGWKLVSLREVTSKIGSGATPRGGESAYLPVRDKFALIRSQNIFDHRFQTDGLAFISDKQAAELANAQVRSGDVLLNITGDGITFARACMVPDDILPACVNQHVSIVRANRSFVDPGYLVAYLADPSTKNYIESFNAGGSRRAITKGHIESFQLALPPLSEQKQIGAIVGTINRKIELNRRMNETLEAIASSIFHSWFVDGEMPSSSPLDEIANFLNGLALQKFPPTGMGDLPAIKIAELRRGDTKGSDLASSDIPPEYVVNDGDVLFSWSGSLEVVIWCGGKGALNQHLFKVTSGNYPKWFYYFWVKEHLKEFQAIAASKATTMGHIQRHDLAEALVGVPSDTMLREGDALIAPMVKKMVCNNIESRTLAALRDALVPKLMSSEIRLTDAEKIGAPA